jgi:Coenzyme PQQ synthesis protein D (PqqD)
VDGRLPSSAVPARSISTRVRNVGGTLVLARVGTQIGVELSETAAMIWRAMDGRRTVAELGELLSAAYAVELATATEDAAEMVADLAAQGFVDLPGN